MTPILPMPYGKFAPVPRDRRDKSERAEVTGEPLGRKVVFIGNCQCIKLTTLYCNTLAAGGHGSASHIHPQRELSAADQQALAQADCVVWQLVDATSKMDIASVPSTAQIVMVPLVSAIFLWPFSSRPHPRNRSFPHAPNGPFDPELGDVFLNGLIAEGVDPDDAVQRYLTLDFSKRTNLDRLFELWSDKQRSRDQASGFEMVDFIERRFRDEQVFLTPHHPNLAVFSELARQVFRRMGFSTSTVDRVLATLRVSPFAPNSLPIHPAVARHFGLRWVAEDQRYPLRHEGEFTFPDFVRRYVAYDWNEALSEGIHLARGPNLALAQARLEEGLRETPASAIGYCVLSQVLLRMGNIAAALAAAQTAIATDPSNPHCQATLGFSLDRTGDHAGAEAAFRRALDQSPAVQNVCLELGRLLLQQKRFPEALAVAQQGLSYFPHDLALLLLSAKILVAEGLLDEAESHLRKAIAVKPTAAEPHWQLADVLTLQVRRDVIANYQVVVDADPSDANAQAGLGALRMRFGSYAEAETAFRLAAALSPNEIGSKVQLVNAISRQGRASEALALATDLMRDHPANPSVKALLERLTSQVGPKAAGSTDLMTSIVAPAAMDRARTQQKTGAAYTPAGGAP